MRIKIKDLSGFVLNYVVNKFQATYAPRSHVMFEVVMDAFVPSLVSYSSDKHDFIFNIAKSHPLFTQACISRVTDHSGLWVAYSDDGYGEKKHAMYCDKSEIVAGLRCWLQLQIAPIDCVGTNSFVVDIDESILKALQYLEQHEPLLYRYRSQREYVVEDMKGKFARIAIPRDGEVPRVVLEMANTIYSLEENKWEKYRWFVQQSFKNYLSQHCIMFDSIPLATRITQPEYQIAYEHKDSGFYCGHIFQPTNKE